MIRGNIVANEDTIVDFVVERPVVPLEGDSVGGSVISVGGLVVSSTGRREGAGVALSTGGNDG